MSQPLHSLSAIRFGPYTLDLSSGELHKNGVRLRLPDQPFQILQLLLQHPGEVVTREELRQRLWSNDTFVDFETGLYSAVKKLRDVLSDSAEKPRFVETIPRRGYRFIYPVEKRSRPFVLASPEEPPRAAAPRRSSALTWSAVALMALLAAVGYWYFRRIPASGVALPIRFTQVVPAPRWSSFWDSPTVALSPDGTHVAYVQAEGSTRRLYVRALDKLEGAPLADTNLANTPFFSPDGRWIGYFALGKLTKISVNGGAPVVLCDAPGWLGAAWGPDDTIVFSPALNSGIMKVPSSGGTPQPLTTLDVSKGENSHRWPRFLPGGKAIIFTIKTVKSATFDDAQIAVQPLSSNEHRIVTDGGSDPRYISPGQILFVRAGSLLAMPFNLEELKPAGPAMTVLDGVSWAPWTGAAQYDVSDSGTLAYVAGNDKGPNQSLVWVDRKGALRPTALSPRAFRGISLSPDAKRFAVTVGAANDDIWISEVARGTSTRLTAETGNNEFPIWTPDGKRILFLSDRAKGWNFYWKIADGDGSEELLFRMPSGHQAHPDSFSPDGQLLVYTELDPKTGSDISLLPLNGDRKPRPLLHSSFNEAEGAISPDGKWLAYTSDESGRPEIYVQAFPGPGVKIQVSTAGGNSAKWAHNGRELFYRMGDTMLVVAYSTSPSFTPQFPKRLFAGQFLESLNYDMTPDDQHFGMVQLNEQEGSPRQLNVVVNWFEELKRRLPAK